jgi:FkbM family methyltransferase
MTVVDIGAHVGYYTILAGRRVGRRGRVIAIEPDPVNHALLRANLQRNAIRNVETHELVAWDRGGSVTLARDPTGNTGDNRVGGSYPERQTLPVASIALDEILENRDVHAVKIDAQGTDHVAVHGMERMLRRCQPVMFVEFWPDGIEAFGDDPLDVAGYYQRLGFRMSLLGAQAEFETWLPENYVEVARAFPGGFATLIFRP